MNESNDNTATSGGIVYGDESDGAATFADANTLTPPAAAEAGPGDEATEDAATP